MMVSFIATVHVQKTHTPKKFRWDGRACQLLDGRCFEVVVVVFAIVLLVACATEVTRTCWGLGHFLAISLVHRLFCLELTLSTVVHIELLS